MSDGSTHDPIRDAVREKYAAPERRRNRPLDALAWLSLAGAVLGLVALLVVVTDAGSPLTVAVWATLIIPFLGMSALSLIAYLSVRALVQDRAGRDSGSRTPNV